MSFCEMVHATFERGSLPESLKIAVVQLIFKNENSRIYLSALQIMTIR